MKTFRATYGRTCKIVTTTSETKAARLMGISRAYISESNNAEDIRIANQSPGTVYGARSVNGHFREFKPIT